MSRRISRGTRMVVCGAFERGRRLIVEVSVGEIGEWR